MVVLDDTGDKYVNFKLEFSDILSRQRYRRSFQANKGDIEKHIGDLKKTSVRGKLQEAKETVAPPSEKHVRKGEPSL